MQRKEDSRYCMQTEKQCIKLEIKKNKKCLHIVASSWTFLLTGNSFLGLSTKNVTRRSINCFVQYVLKQNTFSLEQIFGFCAKRKVCRRTSIHTVPKLDLILCQFNPLYPFPPYLRVVFEYLGSFFWTFRSCEQQTCFVFSGSQFRILSRRLANLIFFSRFSVISPGR